MTILIKNCVVITLWITCCSTGRTLRANAICRVMPTAFAWALIPIGLFDVPEGAAGR
jgi:hypothetical protein